MPATELLLVIGGESGGLGAEVVPFRNARCPARRREEVRNGGLMIAGHLVQMGASGVEPMVVGQSFIRVQRQ